MCGVYVVYVAYVVFVVYVVSVVYVVHVDSTLVVVRPEYAVLPRSCFTRINWLNVEGGPANAFFLCLL